MMDRRSFRSLELKLTAMTLCLSLVPLLGLGAVLYDRFSAAYADKVAESLKTRVENTKGALDLFLDERVSQLVTVAHTTSYERLTNEEYLASVFNAMQWRSKSLLDLGVIDHLGNHVAYVGPYYELLKPVNYAREEWFQAVTSAGTYISDVFLGFRRIPHFIIAVTRIEGHRTWILRATINSDIIEGIVRNAQHGKRGDAFVVNERNVLQTMPRHGGKLFEKPEAPDFSGVTGVTVESAPRSGGDMLFACAKLGAAKWVAVIREDPAEGLAPFVGVAYGQAAFLTLVVTMVTAGAVLGVRTLTGGLIRRLEAEANAAESQTLSGKMAALGKMAAGVAHEINNPLQIIGDQAGWMGDLLSESDLTNNPNAREFREGIRNINRQVERAKAVTQRLLLFGRRMEPHEELVDVNRVLLETAAFLDDEARFRDISVVKILDEALPKVVTDQAQLQQVFLSVIDNAIDAIGKGGVITLRTAAEPGPPARVTVHISDTGPGIPKEVMKRIFDPFFSTKKPNEGSGLGLSISYGIMEKLGGGLMVESEEQKGTTFVVSLPVRRVESHA
jgi:two-component system NtrC family sensor kinase